jgi:hypothetical protein
MHTNSSTTLSLETLRRKWVGRMVPVYTGYREGKTNEWDELLEDVAPNLDMSKSPEEAKSLFLKVALGYELDDDVSYVKVRSIEPDLSNVKLRDDQRLVDRRFADGSQVKYLCSEYIEYDYTYDSSKIGLDYIFTDPYEADCIPTWMNGGGCVIKCILLQFKEGWDKYQNSLARTYKLPLTAEYLIELFDAKAPEYAVSIEVMVKRFFEPFGMSLRVYDREMSVIYRFDPQKECRKFGSVLSVIALEGHFFRINSRVSKLSAKMYDLKQWTETASSSFRLPLEEKKKSKEGEKGEEGKLTSSRATQKKKKKRASKTGKDETLPIICLFIQDIEKLSGIDFTLPAHYTITTETKITHLLKYLWTEKKVRPEISCKGTDLISSLTVMIGGSSVRFISLENNSILRALNFKSQAQFELYNSYSDRQGKAVMTEMNKSSYSEDWVWNAFNTCPKALMGRVADGDATDVADIVKCYTGSVLALESYLVLSAFDKWQIYEGDELVGNNFYTVCRDVDIPQESLMWVFLNQARVSYPGYMLMKKIDGRTLMDLLKPYAHIGYWCPVSNAKKTVGEWKKVIHEMYSVEASKRVGATTHSQNKISTNLKIGILERTVNRKSVSMMFGDKREAIEYAQKINELAPDAMARCSRFYGIDSVGDEYQPEEGVVVSNDQMMSLLCDVEEKEQMWIVQKQTSSPMINGFYPIKMQIYAEGRLQLYQLCKRVVELGGKIIAVKTDAVYFKRTKAYPTVLSGRIGEYTQRPLVEKDTVPDNEWRQNEDMFKPFVPVGVVLSELASEENWDEEGGGERMVQEAMSSWTSNRLMITAETAGAGKTWLGIEMVKESVRRDGRRCVLASFSNRRKNALKRDMGGQSASGSPELWEVCTVHHLLGIRMDDGQETGRTCMMDLTTVGLLMIDEIYLLNTRLLGKLVKLLARYPHVKLIATGDALQQRIDDIKVRDNTKYMEEVMTGILPYGLKLRVNKRLKSAEDRANVVEVKQSLLVRRDEAWRGYVGEMREMKEVIALVKKDGSKLITYTQNKRRELNELVHSLCLVGGEIAVGVFSLRVGVSLTVKRRVVVGLPSEKVMIHCGEEGVVSGINAEGVELTFEDGRVAKVGSELFGTYNSFDYSYCNTAVATQGDTYDYGVIIFETEHFGMTNNAIYTSITRPRSLSQVWIWRGDDQKGDMAFLEVKKSIEARISGHKVADREAGRLFIEGGKNCVASYVDYQWVKEKMDECCCCWCCGKELTFDKDDEESCLSIDRIDDKKAHVKGNCRLGCRSCNMGHQNNAIDPEEVEVEEEPEML